MSADEKSSQLEFAEILAQRVHDAWMASRLAQGWRFGPKRNDEKKLHPCLVPYQCLPENEKEIDRSTVNAVLHAIEQENYMLVKKDGL